MNDGVKILLERMKTHPEEFVVEEGVPAKWDNLIRSYETILDPEDIALFRQARAKLLQQQFTEKVLEELVDPKKLFSNHSGYQNDMPSVTITPNPSIPNLTFEIPKEHKTLFGKLFNYS
jgi:F420-dependent methylenetetrahydromethanopterin dehydrogenase